MNFPYTLNNCISGDMHWGWITTLLLWMKLVQGQWWTGYYGAYQDPYSQYTYGQYNKPYGVCSYADTVDDAQKPIIVVIDDNEDENGIEWLDIITAISTLSGFNNNRGFNQGPVYIPYPVPVGGNDCCNQCNNCGSGCHSECGCRKECHCDDCSCSCNNRDGNRKNGGCCNSCGNVKHKCDRCHNY